jgi:hypothetical protein
MAANNDSWDYSLIQVLASIYIIELGLAQSIVLFCPGSFSIVVDDVKH